MAKPTRRPTLPDDMPANPHEVGDFLRAFGRQPPPTTPKKAPAPRTKVPAAKPRRIRNPAEARWLAQVWAEEAEARRAQKFNVDIVDNTTPSKAGKRAASTWWDTP
jgi:hypothetical protein